MKNRQFIYNGYEYNDCGVCINFDVPYEFGKDHYYYFKIEIAESPKGWCYGFQWSCGMHGGCSPCTPTWKTFPTRSKAIKACAEALKKNFTGSKAKSFIDELDRIIDTKSTPKFQSRQLTIFDVL